MNLGTRNGSIVALAVLLTGCGERQPAATTDHPTAPPVAVAGNTTSDEQAMPDEDAEFLTLPSDLPDAEPTTETVLPTSTVPTTAKELLRIRAQHDATTWKDEVEAQRYERAFVLLWDQLLFGGDKYEVLKSFPIGQLRLAKSLAHAKSDWGITISRFSGDEWIITSDDWPAFLDEFQKQGYEIVETEWHHQKFEPSSGDEPTRSVVSTLIHVNHAPTNRRMIIKGNLAIDWATKPQNVKASDSGKVRYIAAKPAEIDASDLRIVWREGDPAFSTKLVKAYDRDATGRRHPSTLHPIIILDLNEDGLPEVIIGGYSLCLWNEGDFNFRAAPLCEHKPRHPNCGVFADFTGDGVVDYFCGVKNGFPHLYQGEPGGKFPHPPRVLKIADQKLRSPTGLAAGDIDGDNDLDVLLGQQKPSYTSGDIPTPYFDANDGFPSFLLLNDGTGNFRDVINEVGLNKKSRRRNYSVSIVDLNDDHHLDLLLTSDFAGTDIFFNDGHGKFTDVTDQLQPRSAAFGMSHTFGDYDLDGRLDFLTIGMSSTTARRLDQMNLGRPGFEEYNEARMKMGYGNRMYLARGDSFVQAPFNESVARTGWSWGSTTLDFDCDGDQDLYVCNGQFSGKTTRDYCTRFWCHDIYYKQGTRPELAIRELFSNLEPLFSGNSVSWNGYEHNALLMNLDGKEFLSVGYLMGVAFEFDSRCVVSGDLDADGQVDLVVEQKDMRNNQSIVHFVRNRWNHPHHWIGVRLRRNATGPSPLGAKVIVQLNDGTVLLQHNVSGHSVWAQHDNTVHFGLGNQNEVASISVRWPDGSQTKLTDPDVDKYHIMRPTSN